MHALLMEPCAASPMNARSCAIPGEFSSTNLDETAAQGSSPLTSTSCRSAAASFSTCDTHETRARSASETRVAS